MLQKLKNLGLALLILTALTNCTTNTNADFCLIYEPVFMDYENDTPETINQVDKNNVVYDGLCL